MQRIHSVTNPQGKANILLHNVRQAFGSTPNFFTVIANAPAAFEAYLGFNKALSDGKLDAKLREQLAVTIAGFNGCDYCASAHTYLGNKAGVDATELQANLAGHSMDKKTQAALSFAVQLMESRGHASNEALQAMKSTGYTDEEIIEILAHVALNTFSNYFNQTVQTNIDFPVVNTHKARKAA